MSTCDRMQVTHMLDGLGRMDAPQRQQRLYVGSWMGLEREGEGDGGVSSCRFVFFLLFCFSKLSETVEVSEQQHSHMALRPLRDKRRGRSRAVEHHRKEKERRRKEESVSRTTLRVFCVCARAKMLSRKREKRKRRKRRRRLSLSLSHNSFQRTVPFCFPFVVLSPW